MLRFAQHDRPPGPCATNLGYTTLVRTLSFKLTASYGIQNRCLLWRFRRIAMHSPTVGTIMTERQADMFWPGSLKGC
jgi:hypothetical protein